MQTFLCGFASNVQGGVDDNGDENNVIGAATWIPLTVSVLNMLAFDSLTALRIEAL